MHTWLNYPETVSTHRSPVTVCVLRDLLNARGYVDGEALYYVEDAAGRHNEADWARRSPAAIDFLLS
jgi:hypothetical protein